jgi:DNA modification methylase
MNKTYYGDCLPVLGLQPDESVSMIYTDPPFGTNQIRTSSNGQYIDRFGNYIGFLGPRLEEMRRIMNDQAVIWVHLDWRESHYVKVFLDHLFGRNAFINEIIWHWDYGGRGKRCFPKKSANILVYAKNPKLYYFDWNAVPRVPYLAPGLAGPIKAAKGKAITNVWWHTIVPTNGKLRVGYPDQKPAELMRRAIAVTCPPEGVVLDAFAGSGTTALAAHKVGNRPWIMIDENRQAIDVMKTRFAAENMQFDLLDETGKVIQ